MKIFRNMLIILTLFMVNYTVPGYSFIKPVNYVKIKDINQENKKNVKFEETLNSLKRVDKLYLMRYYANYDSILEAVNNRMIRRNSSSGEDPKKNNFRCTMFTALGNNYPLYGRNFDNPDCGVLLCKYTPADGYESVAFSRINDFGFSKDLDLNSMTIKEKEPFLQAAYFVPDGINECGVTAALAFVKGRTFKIDKNKKSIFITRLVREILDHAANTEEAVGIVRKYNIFDNGEDIISHHILISDPSGKSVIMEFSGGEWKEIYNTNPWQVISNSYLYNVPLENIKTTCWRYKTAYEQLQEKSGDININEGMNILKNVSVPGTRWSAMYDMKNRTIDIVLYRDYSDIIKISFDDSRFN